MILFSTNLQEVFANPPVRFFYIIRMYDDEDTTVKAITSGPYDIQIDGVNYISDGNLQGITPTKISTVVDRETFGFQLSDPSFTEGSFASSGYISLNVDVRVCFLSPITNLPYGALEDTIHLYTGIVDGTAYKLQVNETGESILQVTCTSPLADLEHKKYIYLSRDYIRNKNPLDSSCDMIYGGSGILKLKWGKT